VHAEKEALFVHPAGSLFFDGKSRQSEAIQGRRQMNLNKIKEENMKKGKNYSRILSLLLAVCMVFTMMPAVAWADETPVSELAAGETMQVENPAEEPKTAEPVVPKLTALQVAVGGSTAADSTEKIITPAFAEDVLEYSMELLDYEGSTSKRFVYVKAAAPEGTVITAKCGDSAVSTIVSGSEDWTRVAVEKSYMYWGQIQTEYSGCLKPASYNELIITVSAEGAEEQIYTVTIPMEADLANSKLNWKTNLASAVYFRPNAEASLSVEAEYLNRPLNDKNEITYQWYSNTEDSTEGSTAIAGAAAAAYAPSTAALGTTYYYAVASCGEKSITSKVIAVTISDETAPTSLTIKCDHPYFIENTWAKALDGKKFIAEAGDSMRIYAVDENGEETPVTWEIGSYPGGTFDEKTGTYTMTSTSYTYFTAVSLLDPTVKSEEKAFESTTYKISEYNKNISVQLSSDGQSTKQISTSGGVSGYNVWTYDIPDGVASLNRESGTWIYFDVFRPGVFTATVKMPDIGDGMLTDTATLTVNGVAVETNDGVRTKTYLELSESAAAPTVQLKAYTMPEDAAVTWSSSDETIAVVDENGLVTATGIGTALISANDGTYTGGIKVVVRSAEKPYFESLNFTSGYSGVTAATWSSSMFKPTTLKYEGLALNSYSANLTLTADTLYDAEKCTAVAEYTDEEGNKQEVTVSNGAATTLPKIAFDASEFTVTLTDKEDADNKTVYTFDITRPRDTSKAIKYNGIVMNPSGRNLLSSTQNDKKEGTMYVANDDGTLAQYSGVSSSRKYYRTYALNGLEAFSLDLAASTNYIHIRYSTDNEATWDELTQGKDSTAAIFFPETEGETNPEVKVIIQLLDDKTYAANVAAGKDGFSEGTYDVYTVWVEQLPSTNAGDAVKMLTGSTDKGDWYPAFHSGTYSYRIVSDGSEAAPVLTYTVSDGAVVKVGTAVQTPDADGNYTLSLTRTYQEITITTADGSVSQTYFVGWTPKSADGVPDKVIDYLPINSQYTNTGQYGMTPERTLTDDSDVLSLGNFGGYVTYYYEDGLTDNPNNKYGVDFYIHGNSFTDTSTGTGLGAMEPGQVWVSEDGENWYALAGSEHYEDDTLWDYEVTYTKTKDGKTSWTDNYGNQDNGTQVGTWPMAANYPLNSLLTKDTITLRGILLPCWDGSLTGNGTFASYSSGAKFGYVDVQVSSKRGEDANPYLANPANKLESSGFDLAWAVDAKGNPVDVSEKEFHYVKVVSASNLWAGMANEKSTEVDSVIRTTAQTEAVGITAVPEGVTISDGADDVTVKFKEGKQVYDIDLEDMKYVSIQVNGAAEADNIYINNQRVAAGEAAEGFKVTKEAGEKMVRIIVQNGDKEPVIYLLKLTSDATESSDLIDGVKVTVAGVNRVADTKDGKTYTTTVGYRMNEIGIVPVAASDVEIKVNGEEPKDSYALTAGENTFTITAVKGTVSQTVTLTVTKEAAPESTGQITVHLTVKGDILHGEDGGTHTLKKGGLTTWMTKSYTVNAPISVVEVVELAVAEKGWSYTNPGGNYIAEINGLAEFDNGRLSGWMYTLNGTHPNLGVAEQFLENGDRIVLHYTDDYTVEEGSEQFGGVPFSPAGEPTVSLMDENGKVFAEAGKTAFDETTGTLIITVNTGYELKDVKVNGVSKGAVTSLTELSAEDKVEIILAKSEIPALSADEVNSLLADLTPVARSVKTEKKNVKVTLKLDDADKEIISKIEAAGYTVKYNFYRSTKTSSKYKSMLIKSGKTYTNTLGKKGNMYYYKVRVQVYDAEGKLIARTALKDCRYANRQWTK